MDNLALEASLSSGAIENPMTERESWGGLERLSYSTLDFGAATGMLVGEDFTGFKENPITAMFLAFLIRELPPTYVNDWTSSLLPYTCKRSL
jgi:hypothetical protein